MEAALVVMLAFVEEGTAVGAGVRMAVDTKRAPRGAIVARRAV